MLRPPLCSPAFYALAALQIWAASGAAYAGSEQAVTVTSPRSSGYVTLERIDTIFALSTTKDYAQYLMDSYQGWELRPELLLNGFSFKFIDHGPCAGVVAHHDSASYLFYRACGKLDRPTLRQLLRKARSQLLAGHQ